MITKEKMLWSAIKFSQLILKGNVWRSVWRICMWILGLKGLNSFRNTTRPLEGTQILFLCLKTHFSNLKEILCISARLPNISKMMISIHILAELVIKWEELFQDFLIGGHFPWRAIFQFPAQRSWETISDNFLVPWKFMQTSYLLNVFNSLKSYTFFLALEAINQ